VASEIGGSGILWTQVLYTSFLRSLNSDRGSTVVLWSVDVCEKNQPEELRAHGSAIGARESEILEASNSLPRKHRFPDG
jgi:hypothetical protein